MRPQGLAFAGLACFALFLCRVLPVLSPLVLAALVWVFLSPLRRSPWASRLLVVTTALLGLWLVHLTGRALLPFVWGAGIAYLLDPFVDRLQRLGVPRVVSSLLLVILLLGTVVAGTALLLPTAAAQIRQIIVHLPAAAAAADRWLAEAYRRLRDLGVPVEPVDIRSEILRADALLSRLAQGALGVTKALSVALSTLLTLILVVVVSFYTLLRVDEITRWIRSLVPPRFMGVRSFLHTLDTTVGAWFRGQLTVAFLVGLCTTAGLLLLSTPYAVLLGLVAALLNLIPTVGLIVTVGIALLLAPTVARPWTYLVKVGIVFGVMQVLENVVISAQVMRRNVGLHPAVVIVSLVVGASLLGPVGILVAVPTTAMLRLLAQHALSSYRRSQFYLGGTTPEEEVHDAD